MKQLITKLGMTLLLLIMSSSVLFAQMKLEGPGAQMTPGNQDFFRVLYEQTELDGSGWASEDFETAYDVYDCQGADDFIVPAGENWDIQTVTVFGTGAPGPFNLVNVEFYADAGGVPAATPLMGFYGISAIDNAGVLTANITGAILGSGTYWLSVQDAAPFVTSGQWFWTKNLTVYNSVAHWRNPANGFGTGATTWTGVDVVFGDYKDFTFILEGESFVEIGNGTSYGSYPSYYGPWSNYWENCHTQQLYLNSELGGGKEITDLGWEFERIAAPPDNGLYNVSIKVVETTISAFTPGSYFNIAGSTEIFSATYYVPATSTGWMKLDIDDFMYTGTANLVVDILWGDNGYWESPYYRTYKDYQSGYRYLVGYADSETPPNYDGASYYRDNMRFYFKPATAPSALEGYVMTGAGLTISGATIGIDGVGITTSGPNGYYFLDNIPSGSARDATAWKSGYNAVTHTIFFNPGVTEYQDFILTAPTMFISPTSHYRTMHPNEYTVLPQTGILNTGDGTLAYNAEVQYPVTDASSDYVVNDITKRPQISELPTGERTNASAALGDGSGKTTEISDGNRDLFECNAGSVFAITPVGNNNAYWSQEGGTYQQYQHVVAATGDWNTVTFWGIFTGGDPQATEQFVIEVYEDGANPGALLASFTADIPSVPTGEILLGQYDIYQWITTIDMQSITDCWLKIASTDLSKTYYWLNSPSAPYTAQSYMGASFIGAHESLACCLEGGGGAGSWLTLDWYSGTVAPMGGLDNIPTNFDASGTASGEVYTADLVFTSDPDVGTITIPCTMTILGDPLVPPSNLEVTLIDDINGVTYMTWDWVTDLTFQYFIVKRDGTVVGSTTDMFFTDYLPDFGTYCYTVQAVYAEGQTVPAGPECIEWPLPELTINSTLPLEQWMWPNTQSGVDFTFSNTGIGTMAWEFPDYVTDFSCTHEVVMYDSWGDGWNGGTLDLYVNGVLTLNAVTLSSGSGPVSIPFTVDGGDEITSTFTCGGWCYECSYEIVDGFGNVIYTDGASGNPTGIPAGACYANCPTPSYIVDVIPASGILPEGGTQTVSVIYNSTGFPAGDFFEDLTFYTNDPNNLEVFIPNIMHVFIPGELTGTVTDCNTGAPLPGVTVTAGTWQGLTGPNGMYAFYVDPGTYDVMFEKLGYQWEEILGVVVPAGVPTVVDMAMCEMPYAPAWVWADPSQDDTYCDVDWALPLGPYEILYDDGSAEELVVWAGPYNENAVRFTPLGYPATVLGGRLFVGDGTFPSGNWFGSEFAVMVYDDDGEDGLPGSVLDSIPVVVTNYGWITFWGLNATITDGDFFLSMLQLQPSPAAPLGVDYTPPTVYRSYSNFGGMGWQLSVYQDFMLRAFVEGPVTDAVDDGTTAMYPPKLPEGVMGTHFFAKNESTPTLSPGFEKGGEVGIIDNVPGSANRDVVQYGVFLVDNFDPDLGPQTGTLTALTATTNLYYTDNAWGGYPQGWYAYAVRALYTNGDVSPFTYSNVVGHLMDVEVTFEVTMCDGSDPDNVEISMDGENYPYTKYFAITDITGIVVFDSVIKGNYDIAAIKVGNQPYTFSDNIQTDMTYQVVMCEKAYPPRNLWVDPLTSWAYWDWPIVNALDEGFEDAAFPPPGWTATTNSCGWFRTDDGSSTYFTIPTWDSWYACDNDDDCGSGEDGSVDYLITPPLDLRESDDFALFFDSYYDGAYGQLAFIEYSYDAGITWEIHYAMPPTAGSWTYEDIDLSSFSGMTATTPVWFAFHADDGGGWASGWAVDNIFIANGLADPIDFYVFLDGGFVAPSDTNSYQYVYLTYGVTYEASVAARYCCGLSEKAYYTFTSEYLIPPNNLDGETFDDAVHIWWTPPMTPGTFDMITEEPRTSMPNADTEYSPMVRTVNATNAEGSRDMWDVLTNFPVAVGGGEAGVESDGTHIFSTKWNGNAFYQYLPDGTYVGEFTVAGCSGSVRDLAYNPNTGYFYGGAAATTVWEMDFAAQNTVSTINAPVACRAFAYDEDADGFWANNWSDNITLFDMSGAMITSFPVGAYGSYYGFAYDDWADGGPYLWGQSQDGSGAVLVQMEIATGTEVFNLDVLPIVGGSQIAGGLFTHCNIFGNNVVTIGGMLQNELIYGLEYEGCGGGPTPGVVPDNLIGYNVYRDLGVIAYVPYNEEDTSHYYDTGLEPLTYQYDVSALYDLAPYGFPGDTGESALEGPFIIQVTYGHPLPFDEEWVSGSFDLNQWSHEGNWTVNGQIGDPEPSSEFTWDPVITDYRSALTSYPLDGINITDPFIDGNIWFDYTVRLDDRNQTGDEFLKVEVGTQGNWQTIAIYDNAAGNFDWTDYHHNITGIAFGDIFRIRFVAEGVNSVDILSWFVDNIHVYRTCSGPRNLTADNQPLPWEIWLNWNSPAVGGGGGGFGEWIHWDDGVNVNGIGLTGGGVFSVASHWDPDMITAYQGASITKIRFYVYDNVVSSAFTVQVWEGANASNLVYEEAVTGTVAATWYEHTLSTAVPINVNDELWFGYTVNQPDGENPAGNDAGPGVVGYGDMISLGAWEPIANYGFDLNWNLQAYVTDETGETVALEPRPDNTVRTQGDLNIDYGTPSPAPSYNTGNRELQGYNIYRDGDYLDFTIDTSYLDVVPQQNATYTYEVTAVYEDCESDTAAGPVTVDVIVGLDDLLDDEGFAIYPNPAKESVNIMSSQDIKFVTVMNNVGQLVYNSKVVNENLLSINTSSYEAGVYMVKIETENNIIVRKIIIAQ